MGLYSGKANCTDAQKTSWGRASPKKMTHIYSPAVPCSHSYSAIVFIEKSGPDLSHESNSYHPKQLILFCRPGGSLLPRGGTLYKRGQNFKSLWTITTPGPEGHGLKGPLLLLACCIVFTVLVVLAAAQESPPPLFGGGSLRHLPTMANGEVNSSVPTSRPFPNKDSATGGFI